MIVFITMFIMGGILGFVGAGGSGFIIAILITFFHIPVHTALATAMAAMFFTVISGAISHYREGNLHLRIGAIVGGSGAVGAYLGTRLAQYIPEKQLLWMSASLLIFSSFLIWYRTRNRQGQTPKPSTAPNRHFLKGVSIGVSVGTISGTLGIGSAPIIQWALTTLMGDALQKIAGTTMMVILPISFFAAIGYSQSGYLDVLLLFQVVAGTMTGSYIGAKFTKRVPKFILRFAMILTPFVGGMLLLVQ